MARRLHYQKPWEKLAEDPFRGLRAGPANFSPFHFCRWWPGTPPVLPTPPNTPITEHGRGVPKRRKNENISRVILEQSCRFNAAEFLRTKEYRSSRFADLAAARFRMARGIVLQGKSQHNRQPEKAGDDHQLSALRTVFTVHEK